MVIHEKQTVKGKKSLDRANKSCYDSKGTKSRVIHSHLAASERAMVKPFFHIVE